MRANAEAGWPLKQTLTLEYEPWPGKSKDYLKYLLFKALGVALAPNKRL
jgi:hypothetical protein